MTSSLDITYISVNSNKTLGRVGGGQNYPKQQERELAAISRYVSETVQASTKVTTEG